MLAVIGRCQSGQNVVLWLQPIWLVIIMHKRLGSCSIYLHRSAESPSIRFGLMSFWNEQFSSLTYPLSYLIVALLIYIHCFSEDLIHLSFFLLVKFCIKTESSTSWMHISLITYIQPKSSIAHVLVTLLIMDRIDDLLSGWFLVGGGVSLLSSLSAQVSKIWDGIQAWGYTFICLFFITFYVSSRSVFYFNFSVVSLHLCCMYYFSTVKICYYINATGCGLCGRLHTSAG